MAITSSAKKEIKSSAKKRVFNLRRSRDMKKNIKAVEDSIKGNDVKAAKEKYKVAQKSIDKALKRGIIKKNNASRKKANLIRKIKSIK